MRVRRLAAAVILCAGFALADSPLTSTDFASAYADVPAVKQARAGNTEAAFSFLASTAGNDEKLAVANALGWGRDFATGFFEHLARLRGVKAARLEVKDLNPSQLFVAGYLIAMADAFELKPGATGVWAKSGSFLVDRAAGSLKEDFTVHYVQALVKAQKAMSGNGCDVFRLPNDVLKRFPVAKRNLRPAALEAAQGYLALYEDECPGSKAAERVQREEFNQAYTLSKLGAQIVVGAQGGVVVWDPAQDQPIARRPGFICRGLTWGNAVWHGCQAEVVRWDGANFKAFLARSTKDSSAYYQPMQGPDGKLWVRLGIKTWEFDEAAQRFKPVTAPWATEVEDARFFEGQPHWLDPRSLHVGTVKSAFRSDFYPGADPRAFSVDARGKLWVEDFQSGAFCLENGRFVKQAGLEAKSTGVAYDVERKRLWLLHYTEGLVLVRDGQAPERIDLSELEYMRDLLLDPATGDVWVGGWAQLMRLRADGPTWDRQRFRVK
jgi:hypothetical protein